MKNENLIHIKFGYESALDRKKDILSSEIDLLKIAQRLNEYKKLRMLELDIKNMMEKKLISLKLDIGRLQNLLPIVAIPKILKPTRKKAEEVKTEREIITPEAKKEKSSIDDELLEIQRRLESLGS